MLIAALLTVMYGEQLSTSLRDAINKHPAVKTVLEQAAVKPAAVEPAAVEPAAVEPAAVEPAAVEPVAVEPAAVEPVAVEPAAVKPAVADSVIETPAAASTAPPSLEQRWQDYAANAAELMPAGSYPWQQCFQRAAASYELPQALLLAIASGESDFDPAAISDKNAIGLMQIRWPTTSHHLGVHRQADLYDPCTNVDAGARYLSELAQQYGNNLHLVVAAYNYGPNRVSREKVPEGATWYSHYIYQHLQQVLGLEPPATSELIARPAGSEAGREVLMSFNRAHRARDFIAFLTAQVPGLNLQQQSESLGRHDVVLLYADRAERSRALDALGAAGLEVLGPQSRSTYHL
jgi:soluble lytic murein transglycosylase-like protein